MAIELFSPCESNSGGVSTALRPILLATDDPNDVFTFWGYHKQCGVHNRVEVVSDGEDALRYLASTSLNYPLPALVIISLKTPRIGGLTVLEHLAGTYPKLSKVLMIDEKDHDVGLIAAAYKLGVDAFLMRPLVKDEFCNLMSRIGESLTMDGCPKPDALTQPANRANPKRTSDDAPAGQRNSSLPRRSLVFPPAH
jgi:DNA-binding NarL/FixJ family response regulator